MNRSKYDIALEKYLNNGIDYWANTIVKADQGDLEQLAADSYWQGWQDNQSSEIKSLKKQLEKERELIERCKSAVQHTTKDRSLLNDIDLFLTQNQSNDVT